MGNTTRSRSPSAVSCHSERDPSPASARKRSCSVRASWALIALGMISGSVLGLWSFGGPVSPPAGFTDYAELLRTYDVPTVRMVATSATRDEASLASQELASPGQLAHEVAQRDRDRSADPL